MNVANPNAATRVGTEHCSVTEIANSVKRFSERYLDRIYTRGEAAYFIAEPSGASEHPAARIEFGVMQA